MPIFKKLPCGCILGWIWYRWIIVNWNCGKEHIDTSDIPEITDWSKAEIGKFYRKAD